MMKDILPCFFSHPTNAPIQNHMLTLVARYPGWCHPDLAALREKQTDEALGKGTICKSALLLFEERYSAARKCEEHRQQYDHGQACRNTDPG
jgi:hypothetical protein